MRPRDRQEGTRLARCLRAFVREVYPLPGIESAGCLDSFVEQLLESEHRVQYVRRMLERDVSPQRADCKSALFDPLKAAIIHAREGRIDEAFWLVFLSVHFGKHLKTGWRLARDVYGALGLPRPWTWARISRDTAGFSDWLQKNEERLRTDGIPRHFGNHRKYETLKADSMHGTARVFESYVNWVAPPRTHEALVAEALEATDGDRRLAFDRLYISMSCVIRFGRTAKFDYLTMLGKLSLADIEPGSTYMNEATGPAKGARLLFAGRLDAHLDVHRLDRMVVELESRLLVGMQVMEDALCNWQKSPSKFRPFRG